MSTDEYVTREEYESLRSEIDTLKERLEGFTDYMADNPTETDNGAAKDYPLLNKKQAEMVDRLREEGFHGNTYATSGYQQLIREYGGVGSDKTVKNWMRDLAERGPFQSVKIGLWQFEDSQRENFDRDGESE